MVVLEVVIHREGGKGRKWKLESQKGNATPPLKREPAARGARPILSTELAQKVAQVLAAGGGIRNDARRLPLIVQAHPL